MAYLWQCAIAVSLVALCLAVRDGTEEDDATNLDADIDGYEEAFTHFHVTPSTHRGLAREHEQEDYQGVTLAVIFAVHPAATMVGFTLPKGYSILEVSDETKYCPKVFKPNPKEISSYAKQTKAESVVDHITNCSVKASPSGDTTAEHTSDSDDNATEAPKFEHEIARAGSFHNEGPGVQLILGLRDDVPGLSKRNYMSNEHAANKLQWWYFHMQVKYPSRNIEQEANFFKFHWSHTHDHDWEGETEFRGWPILGDWECAYSEWEGFGTCSTRCGGGTRQLTRRVLFQPPVGELCNDTMHPDIEPCNEHACLWGCEFEEGEIVGECTASCGGGVRLKRRRFKGNYCPALADIYADAAEPCNTQPCRARCQYSDVWQVVTQCDELCGPGKFWMMRQVLSKDSDDAACQPLWKQVPCMRQVCNQFTVTHPDPNILPTVSQTYLVGLIWTQTVEAKFIEITAPIKYSFGKPGGKCEVAFHSLMPHFESCQVGGTANIARLQMYSLLPNVSSSIGRYELQIQVTHPTCKPTDWDPDPIRGTLTCNVGIDQTVWSMMIQGQSETLRESITAQGYYLFWPASLAVPALLTDEAEEDEAEDTTTTTTAEDTPANATATGDEVPAPEPCPPGVHLNRKVARPFYCMRDRDPAACEEKYPNSICGWDNVCKVIQGADA